MEDERQKKIQAGRERLVAFQKKKARKKTKPVKDVSETSMSSDETLECSSLYTRAVSSVDTFDQSSLDTLDLTSSESLSYDSDELSLTSSGEVSSEEFENSVVPLSLKRDFAHATERIAELEESLLGKQLALESLVKENNQLKTTSTKHQEAHDRPISDCPGEAELSTPYSDIYLTETHQLMEQVQVLQKQLQKAGQVLNIQMSQHHFSAQALLDAKNQMLGLQDKIMQKDRKITKLEEHILRDNSSSDTVDSHSLLDIAQSDIRALKSENEILRQQLENFESGSNQLSDYNEKLLAQLNSMKNRETELLSVNEALKQNLEVVTHERTELTRELDNVKQQLSLSLQEAAVLQTENEYFKTDTNTEEKSRLKKENETLKQELEMVNVEAMNPFHSDTEALEIKNESLKQMQHMYQAENYSTLEAEIETLKQKLSVFNEEEIGMIKSENESLKKNLNYVNFEEINHLKAENESFKIENESLKQMLDTYQVENSQKLEAEIESLRQKLALFDKEGITMLKCENESLKEKLFSVNLENELKAKKDSATFDDKDLPKSHNDFPGKSAVFEQLDFVKSDDIVAGRSAPSVYNVLLESNPLGISHKVEGIIQEYADQLISVSVIESQPEDSVISRTANISNTTFKTEVDETAISKTEFDGIAKSETDVEEPAHFETEFKETIKVETEVGKLVKSEIGVDVIVKSETEAEDSETSGTYSEIIKESEQGVTVKPSEFVETIELQSDTLKSQADDTQFVIYQHSADMKSLIIADIESRLCELEGVNAQLKLEKDQLLQDFEGLMSSLELFKVAEDEKEKLREKLELELDRVTSEVDVLRTNTKDKDFEIENLKFQLERVNANLLSVTEEKILFSESVLSEQTMLKDQVSNLNTELETANTELSRIKNLVLDETNEVKLLELHEVIQTRLENTSQELAEALSEKQLAENKFREIEFLLQDYVTLEKTKDVSLQEQTNKLVELQLHYEEMVQEKVSATEQIEGLRGQLMSAENELQELRYESETMQSLISDINKEKEDHLDVNQKEEVEVSGVEHEELQHQLSEVLQENILLKECLKEKEDDLEKYEADNSVLQDSISTAEQEIENLKLQAESLQTMPEERVEMDDSLQLNLKQEQTLESVNNFLLEAKSVIPELVNEEFESNDDLLPALQHIHERLLFLNSRHLYVEELEAMQQKLSKDLEQSKIHHQKVCEELNMTKQSYNSLEQQLENNVADLGPTAAAIKLEEFKIENTSLCDQLAHFQNRVDELEESLKDANIENEKLNKEVETATSKIEERQDEESQISELSVKLEQLEKSNQMINESLTCSELKCSEMNKVIESFMAEKEEFLKSLKLSGQNYQSAVELMGSKENRVEELTIEITYLQGQLSDENEKYHNILSKMEVEMTCSQKDLNESRNTIIVLTQQLEDIKNQLNGMSLEKAQFEESMKELESELAISKDSLFKSEDAVTKAYEELSQLKVKYAQQIEELKAVQAELHSTNQAVDEAKTQMSSLGCEKDKRIGNLVKEVDNLTSENDRLHISLSETLEKYEKQCQDLDNLKQESNSTLQAFERIEKQAFSASLEKDSINEDLISQVNCLTSEKESLAICMTDTEHQLQTMEEENTNLKAAMQLQKEASFSLKDELLDKVEEMKSSKEEANAHIKTLETELEQVQSTLLGEKEKEQNLIEQLDRAQAELNDRTSNQDKLIEKAAAFQEQISELNKILEEERKVSDTLKTELSEHQNQSAKLQLENDKLSQSLFEVEVINTQDAASLQSKLNESIELKREVEDLSEELQFLKNENKKLISKSQSLMNELEFSRTQHSGVLENIQQEFEKQSSELIRLEGQLSRAKEEASNKSGEFDKHQLNQEKQLRSLEEDKAQLKSDNDYLNQHLDSAINKGKFFEGQISSYETQVKMLNNTAEALRQDKLELEEELESLKSGNMKQESVFTEKEKLKKEIKDLSQSLEDADTFIESLRADKMQLCEELETVHSSTGTTSSDSYQPLQIEIKDLKQKVTSADSYIEKVRSENNQLSNELQTLTEEKHRISLETDHALKTVMEEIRLLKQQLEDSDGCAKTLTEKNTLLSQEIQELLNQKDKTKQDFDHSIEIFKDEINYLQKELKNLKEENYAAQDLIKELENVKSVKQIGLEYCDEYVQTEDLETDQIDNELKDVKAERDKFKKENTATEDQYQKLLTEYQSDVECLRCELEEKVLNEQYTRDELETSKRRVKTLTKENHKLQAHYQNLTVTAAKFGITPENDSSQESTEVEDLESEEDNTDTDEEQLETLKLSENDFNDTSMRVLIAKEKQASVEVDDKMSLSESIQEEDAEIQAQYKAMLQDSAPQKGSSGITYTEEEYEEKLESLAAKFEDELQCKEDYIVDQHAMDMERMRIEWEYDFRMAKDQMEKEKNLEYTQKVEAFKVEKEREFVEELRKSRLEIQRTCDDKLKQHIMPQHLVENNSDLITEHEKLRLENQELGEARDALLQQLNASIRRQKNLEDVLDIMDASPAIIAAALSDTDPKSPRDSNRGNNQIMPLHFEPEIDFCQQPFSSASISDFKPEHDSFEFEDALRNSERLSELENLKSPLDCSGTGAATIDDDSSDDSLGFDSKTEFDKLQSEYDQLLVKANDLEEQVLRLSPAKQTGTENSGNVNTGEQLLLLKIERETLEHKIKEQRELFSVEKSDLQQKCNSLTYELETISLYKKNLEQELESMTEAFAKRESIDTNIIFSDTNQVTVRSVETSTPSVPFTLPENQNVLVQKVTELSQKCSHYESVICDLKEQIQTMRSGNAIFAEEVTQQEEMQRDLFEEVKRLDGENDTLLSYLSQSNQTQREPSNMSHEEIRSTDSLETMSSVPKDVKESPYEEAAEPKILEEKGWGPAYDEPSRLSSDSLGDFARSNASEDERSPDSLDDVSSLCDQMYTTALSMSESHKQDVSTETVFVSFKNASTEIDSDSLWCDTEDKLGTEERFYQLEMEKILLKGKVSKLEEELAKLEPCVGRHGGSTGIVSSWVEDNDRRKYSPANHWKSSSESLDNSIPKRLGRESSSMVESSSTATSHSGGSVENLVDARFREKRAVRYPVMGTDRDTSSSPSPAKESSSFPSVFERESASGTDKEIEEDLFSSSTMHSENITDQLADLSKEMKETQDIYVREKALLQEALDREQENKEFFAARIDSGENSFDSGAEIDYQTMKQKLALANQTIKFLRHENEEWIHRVKKQETLVFHLRESLESGKPDVHNFEDVFGQQFAMLKDHRNELLSKLDEKLNAEKMLAHVMNERTVLEENLRIQKELLAEKMVDKSVLESEMLELRVELERTTQEQRFLEEKLYQKDKTEKQLMRQKRMLEEELYEIESKLREREAALELEKRNLLCELKEKDFAIRRYEARQNSSSWVSGLSSPRLSASLTSLSAVSCGSSMAGAEGGRITQMEGVREELEEKHKDAISILRHQMSISHSVEELRLREQHTADLAALNLRHRQQLDSVKCQYEVLMKQLEDRLSIMQHPDHSDAGDMEGKGFLQQKQCQQVLLKLKQLLNPLQNEELDNFLTTLEKEHKKTLEVLEYQHSEDVLLQLQAMRISVEQVESSRCEVLRTELQKDTLHKLANQREELAHDYEHRIQLLEKSLSESLLGCKTHTDKDDTPTVSSKILIRQLEKSLHEEHNQLLKKLNQEPVLLREQVDTSDSNKTENRSEDMSELSELLKICSQIVTEYKQLETLSAKLEDKIAPENEAQLLTAGVSNTASAEMNSSGWEVEIEDDSEDFSESDRGDFVVESQQKSVQNEKSLCETTGDVNTVKELTDKISNLQTKLKEIDMLKDALEESDKQVKELVDIANSKDEMLTQLEVDSDLSKNISEFQRKLTAAEERISSLEESLEVSEKQNSELSEKFQTQLRLFKELEHICQTQENSLSQEREMVQKLNCDIKDKESQIQELKTKLTSHEDSHLEQRSGMETDARNGNIISGNICDKTADSEVLSTDTSLNESQDEVSRALRGAEIRHAEEMEDLTQVYNEEQDKLRESLKAARAKEVALSEQLEELGHIHEMALSALREQFQHDHKVEIETMRSEFDAQMQVEAKRISAKDLSSKQETEMGVNSSLSVNDGDISFESVEKLVSNGHSDESKTRKELQLAHEKIIREVTLEWEEKVEKTRLELEEQWEDEKTELERKQAQEMNNLQTQLKDMQEKLSNIIEALDSGDFDSPALEEYRVSLQEKVDLELEMAKKVLQDEYEEQTTSLEEYTAEEAAQQHAKFIEQHKRMMDNFIAEKEKEKEEMEACHKEALQILEQQLKAEQEKMERSAGQSSPRSDSCDLVQEPNSKVEELEESHQNEIIQLKEDYEKKLKAFTEDLATTHVDELEAVAMDTEVVQSDLDKAHQQELDDLEDQLSEKHRKELGNLEKQLKGKMDDIEDEHQEEMESLKKQHKYEITKLKNELTLVRDNEDNSPIPQEIVEELSATQDTSLTQYPMGDSDIEIEYESSFIEEEDSNEDDSDGRGTPTKMIETLGFEEAGRLAYEASIAAPDTSLTAPPSEEIEEDIQEEITEAAEVELAQLDQVLEFTLAQSQNDSPETVNMEISQTLSSPPQPENEIPTMKRIWELESEVSGLRTELQSKVQETEWIQRQLVQQSAQYQELRVRLVNYEHLEGESLVNMLRSDADRLGQERDAIQSANDHLLHLLSNSLRLYQSTEENINKNLAKFTSSGSSASNQPRSSPGGTTLGRSGSKTEQSPGQRKADSPSGSDEEKQFIVPDAGGDRAGSPDGTSKAERDENDPDSQSTDVCGNTSLMSVGTDEGLDLSSRVTEIMFSGPDIDPEGEELLRDGSSRLQNAVLQLLDMIGQSGEQLSQAQQVQQDLVETLTAKTEEAQQLLRRCQELDELLQTERSSKECLASELNKTEGLLEGYVAERSELQNKLEETEERVQVLILNLETSNNKLQELENGRGEVDAMRLEVQRQQMALQSNLGAESQEPTSGASAETEYIVEPALIQEINKLNQDKRNVAKQRDKDGERSSSRIRDLEMTVEEIEKHYDDMLEEKKREMDELQLKVESLDNKLKSNRQFIEEQANDREQEREDHQQEVRKLSQIIQEKEKRESVETRLQREVGDLTDEIQIKTDLMNETSLRNEQLQRDLKDKQSRNKELADHVKHLERELEEKTTTEKNLEQKIARLEEELKQDSSTSDETDIKRRAPSDDLKQKITTLEQELEAKERTIYHERESLEEELRKARRLEEELTNEKDALQKQVYDNLHQISQLKTQLDEFKHRYDPGSSDHVAQLKLQLEEEREAVERKEKEVSDLVSQVDQFRDQAMDSDETVQQLTNQLKVSEKQLESLRSEENQTLKDLMEENNRLKIKCQQSDYDPAFHQSLLEDKNKEIDDLTQDIERLRADQSTLGDNAAMKSVLDSLRIELEQKSRDVEELQQTVDNLQHSDALLDTTVSEGDLPPMPSLTERMSIQDEFSNALAIKDDEVMALYKDLQLKEAELSQAKSELETSSKIELSPLNEALLLEKDSNIEQLSVQVATLQTEVNNLTDFQGKLQEDYDMVQNMLEEKEKEIETLTKELTETRPQAEGATDALMKFEVELEALKRQLKEKDNVIDEKEEELYTLNEKLEEQESKLQNLFDEKEGLVAELQNTVKSKIESVHIDKEDSSSKHQQNVEDKEKSIAKLEQKLDDQAAEQEEALGVLRSQLEIAAKALEERDNQVEKLTQALGGDEGSESLDNDAILSLKEKLREAEEERDSLEEDRDYLNRELEAFRSEVNKYKQDIQSHQTQATEKSAEVERLREQLTQIQREAERIEELTDELNRTRSQLQMISASNSALSLDGATDVELEQVREELQKAKIELEVFKESALLSASEVEQKLETIRHQLQQGHTDKLRDLKQEAERETELKLSELARQHEDEFTQLKDNHQKEMESAVREACRNTEKRMSEEKNLMIQRHNEELQRLRKSLTGDVAVMEVQHQLQSEVATAERLDCRLLEHLSRPRQDGVGHDNPDIPFTEPPLDPNYNPEESVPDRLRVLMKRLHNEGVQMLTLSELQFLKRHSSPVRVEKEADLPALQAAWQNEKQGLLSAIQALKDLLAQIHTHRDSEQITELGVSDWRNDLIAAISKVFSKERETLLAELRTHVVASPSTELSSLQRLENKIRDQGIHHQDSMKQVYSVDRQSLLSEIRDLRSHASITRLQLQDEKQRLTQQLSSTEEQLSKREHQLKRQLELLEYKLKQEQILQDDLRASLSGETTRNQELQSLLNQEHQSTLNLQMELADSQIQIDKLSDSLQQEENRVKTVSDAIEKERSHRNDLSDELEDAKSECRRLQRLAQEEKRKVSQLEDNELNLLQTLQVELEKEKDLHSEVANNLDREKLMVENLRRELQFEKENLHSVENQFKSRLAQLQSHLESERERCHELQSAISREQSLNNQLRNSLEEERGSVQASTERENSIISDLKALLQTERGRLEELQTTTERDRAQLTSLSSVLEDVKQQASEEVQRERRVCRELKKQVDSAQEHAIQLSRQHEVDAGKLVILEREQTQLRSEIRSLKDLGSERDAQRESEKHSDTRRLRELERERDDHVAKLHESDLELQRLRQKLNDLDFQLTSARQTNQQSLRVTSHVNQGTSPPGLDHTDHGEDRLSEFRSRLDRYKTQLEVSRQRLHLLLIKHQEDLNRSEPSMSYSEMATRRKALSDILSELEQLQRPLALDSEARPTISSSPSLTAINDRVMKHNTELTGFVARLSQEKSELRQTVGRLEEELREKQRKEEELQMRGRVDLSESVLLAERASWKQERITLQMSLDHACQEVDRLKGDLRAEQHRALRLTNSFSSESDNEKIQRLYGKYLRCESFKKALIYQKRYLLMLLGGFQACEEETLAIIAKMGVYPSQEDVQRRSRHSKAFSTFRTAARVIIAIHRMKYLVKKWRRATKVGSPVVTSNGHLQHGYLATANTYSPPRIANFSHSRTDDEDMSVGRGIHVYTPTSAHYLPYTALSSRSPQVFPITVSTPPTRDKGRLSRADDASASPGIRRKLLTELDPNEESSARNLSVRPDSSREYVHNGNTEVDQSLHEDYITRLESLQQRLGGLNDPGNLRTKPQWFSVRK